MDAGSGNAYYVINRVTTGTSHSDETVTVTITPENKVTYYKTYVNLPDDGITATFQGNVN